MTRTPPPRSIPRRSRSPRASEPWPSSASSSTPAVGAVADAGDFARLLGVDAPPGAPTPTHRWSALVEDGILLKLHVEEAPGSVTVTSADEMVKWATGFFKG